MHCLTEKANKALQQQLFPLDDIPADPLHALKSGCNQLKRMHNTFGVGPRDTTCAVASI